MAGRAVELTGKIWRPALFLGLAALTLGPVAAVIAHGGLAVDMAPGDLAAIRFTVVQAALSALLSAALAVPVARALARRRFPGRRLAISLLGAPFLLPTVVAVLGILAVYGQSGLIARTAGGMPSIYGLPGVLLAHVFLNLPLAVRILLQGWSEVPSEHFRLAASLSFAPRDTFRLIEWPILRARLPGVLLVVFLICTTSFAVALTLGGGPRATTVELAIYQAFRFDFDTAHAARLALVQLAISGIACAAAFGLTRQEGFAAGFDRSPLRWDIAGRRGLAAADAVRIGAAMVFLLLPLAMLGLRGISGLADLPASVWTAALWSGAVALGATGLLLAAALGIALAVAARGQRRLSAAMLALGYAPLAMSPLVTGTGLFLALNPVTDPRAVALPVTALVNALFTLPFALAVLVPAARKAQDDFGRLADSLGMPPLARLRHVILPRLARPLGFSAGLAAALSMGDLGVIALFAGAEVVTLPMQMFRLMGAYRMDAAMAAAVLLVGLSYALFVLFDRGGRMDA